MAAVSPTEVVSQISDKLRKSFTTDEIKTIYKNTPIQGAAKPYIYIHQIRTYFTKELRRRGELKYFIDVRLHPADSEQYKQVWLNTMGGRLFEILDYIKVSNQRVNGRNIRFEVIDDVLHFFIEYTFKVYKPDDPQPKMRTLHEKGFVSYADKDYYGKRR